MITQLVQYVMQHVLTFAAADFGLQMCYGLTIPAINEFIRRSSACSHHSHSCRPDGDTLFLIGDKTFLSCDVHVFHKSGDDTYATAVS